MIRIVNETGRGIHTQIINAETGEDLTKSLLIHRASIEIDRGKVNAEFDLQMVRCEISADHVVWRTRYQCGGKSEDIAAIEFRDGTRVEFADDGTPKVVARSAA